MIFRLGIIEESLEDKKILDTLSSYLISQRVENVPEDEYPIWHINEYHVNDDKIYELLDILKEGLKTTWYIHAFNDEKLCVALKGKWFEISTKKDETWNEMIEYGVTIAKVERDFLETVPLHI